MGQSEVDVDPDPTLKKKLGPVPTAKTWPESESDPQKHLPNFNLIKLKGNQYVRYIIGIDQGRVMNPGWVDVFW